MEAPLGIYQAYQEVVVLALGNVPCYNHEGLHHGILIPAYCCHYRFIAHYKLVRVYASIVP